MAKVALITDTHAGVRNDNPLFYRYVDRFLDDIFFPIIKERKVSKIIHLGDMFDRRKFINYQTLSWIHDSFMKKSKDYPMDIIVGNHDTYYKNTNDINSPKLLLTDYDNVNVYSDPTEVDNMLYIPWINSENRDKTFNLINNTDRKIVMGHLEVNGYTMFKGTLCHTGLDADIFSKFKSVYTGHFHTKHSLANINYLGCPWDLIFTDSDDVKGFHIYDTEMDSIEFISNPYKMYWKLYYDDSNAEKLNDLLLSDNTYDKLKESYVKVYVKAKVNSVYFDRYIEKINDSSPHSLGIVEDYVNVEGKEEETVSLTEDTLSILKSSINDYIDIIQTDDKKKQIESLLSNLYIEALNI